MINDGSISPLQYRGWLSQKVKSKSVSLSRPGEDIEANCRDLQYALMHMHAYARVLELCTVHDNSRDISCAD